MGWGYICGYRQYHIFTLMAKPIQ
uniref:Uncharacterized protein n=1 Tax=Anguilla anguilla TaxID=7936 RepID=A0A0E9T6I7_ANGAN